MSLQVGAVGTWALTSSRTGPLLYTIAAKRLVQIGASVIWPLSLLAAAGCNSLFCWSLEFLPQHLHRGK